MTELTDTFTRKGRRLEYFTLGWNVIEAAIAGVAGFAAGSTALIGFGIDSLIESLSGGVLLWRLADDGLGEARERVAHRLVAVSFVALAAYVGVESILTLREHAAPDHSIVGIILATVADSRQTDLCAYLSAILLAGLALNALFGWWWADPLAALAMIPIMSFEARRAWCGDRCTC